MRNLIKNFVILSFLLLVSSSVFANELKIENFNEYPLTVYLYYDGDFLIEHVIQPKTTWTFDIGNEECGLYSITHSHYKERTNARVHSGKFTREEGCYKLI